jgi:hypothetical protein
MPKGRKRPPQDFDFTKLVQPASEELKGALESLLHGESIGLKGDVPGRTDVFHQTAQNPPEEALRLVGVRTRSQKGDTSRFRYNHDALVLVIDIAASTDIVGSRQRFHANYQIIDRATNMVERDCWSRNLKFEWGPAFWISMGNDRGPDLDEYSTPAKWGLKPGLYSFRAVLAVEATGMLCRSEETLFQVC